MKIDTMAVGARKSPSSKSTQRQSPLVHFRAAEYEAETPKKLIELENKIRKAYHQEIADSLVAECQFTFWKKYTVPNIRKSQDVATAAEWIQKYVPLSQQGRAMDELGRQVWDLALYLSSEPLHAFRERLSTHAGSTTEFLALFSKFNHDRADFSVSHKMYGEAAMATRSYTKYVPNLHERLDLHQSQLAGFTISAYIALEEREELGRAALQLAEGLNAEIVRADVHLDEDSFASVLWYAKQPENKTPAKLENAKASHTDILNVMKSYTAEWHAMQVEKNENLAPQRSLLDSERE